MPIINCRVCHNNFFDEPLLRYDNTPRAAHFLTDAESPKDDKGVDLQVFQCAGCGLVQLSNDPVPYYKEVMRAAGISKEMIDFRKKQFAGFIQAFSLEAKKVIEIGCGRGEYLSLLHHLGIEAYGLEQAEAQVRQCVENGLSVFQGFIQSRTYKISQYPYDAFFILNFLEHLPDPNSTLQGILGNLTDDGVGLVEVPNFDMILRNSLFSEFTCDHLLYFTKETLGSTLRLNGFDIIDCKDVWHGYIISAVVKKRSKIDVSQFYGFQARLRNEIEEYISRFEDRKVAIWGAGHQALAVISLLSMKDKIRYIIDSAEYKQGKVTPVTHIHIVSPDTLNTEPVDAVIVMAASYSDEVVRILQQKYDRNLNISILRDFGLEVV